MRAGDRVAIAMRNRPEWAVAFAAVALLGAVPAPLNSYGLRDELMANLRDLKPSLLICDAERFAHVAQDLDGLGCRAVVLDGQGLSTEQMQAFAAYINQSETTFVLPVSTPKASYRIRIFTPVSELPFAGHPSVGSAHAVLEAGLAQATNGELVQDQPVSDMIWDIPTVIEYVTAFTPLSPGDVIATGTPGGVGDKRTPPLYMKAGDKVEVTIGTIGTLSGLLLGAVILFFREPIVDGIAFLTGSFSQFGFYLLEAFPVLGRLG